jgi:vacuolar-type H+-ATPase subunit E/Vma4
MPIWGQTELLCRSITEEGRNQSEKLLEQARFQADNMIRDAAQQSERQYQETRLSGKSQAVAEAGQIVDTAELAARRRVMTFRSRLLQDVMDALTQRLKQFRTQPDYEHFLISATREAIAQLSSPDVMIEVVERDAEIIRNRLGELSDVCSAVIKIRSTDAFDGGVRVFTADNKMMFDNSFDARRNRMENDIRQQIWRTMGGTHTEQH